MPFSISDLFYMLREHVLKLSQFLFKILPQLFQLTTLFWWYKGFVISHSSIEYDQKNP